MRPTKIFRGQDKEGRDVRVVARRPTWREALSWLVGRSYPDIIVSYEGDVFPQHFLWATSTKGMAPYKEGIVSPEDADFLAWYQDRAIPTTLTPEGQEAFTRSQGEDKYGRTQGENEYGRTITLRFSDRARP